MFVSQFWKFLETQIRFLINVLGAFHLGLMPIITTVGNRDVGCFGQSGLQRKKPPNYHKCATFWDGFFNFLRTKKMALNFKKKHPSLQTEKLHNFSMLQKRKILILGIFTSFWITKFQIKTNFLSFYYFETPYSFYMQILLCAVLAKCVHEIWKLKNGRLA